jgi:hypothetical protein
MQTATLQGITILQSFLKAKGFKLAATKKNGRDIYFIFEGKEKIDFTPFFSPV